MDFKVSVIIPVYNAVGFINRAVESIIHQKEVGEVILIDDGYSDGAYLLCERLASRYPRIKLLRHPGGLNLGAGASRNLGIENARCKYISFLDADDFALPNRFEKTASAFNQNQAITAVYEPVGTAYSNDEAKLKFCRWRKIQISEAETYLTYVKKQVEGKDFLISILRGNNGTPHINGITIKSSAIRHLGLFNTDLDLHQDSEFWTRLAYYGYFAPVEDPRPVAVRFAHLENRISKRTFHSAYKKEKILFEWAKTAVESALVYRLILKRYVYSLVQWRLGAANIITLSICKIFFIFAMIIHPKSWR